jgi:hypothetical protein
MKVRIVADGAGWTAVPNPGWRARSGEEIAAIRATAA